VRVGQPRARQQPQDGAGLLLRRGLLLLLLLLLAGGACQLPWRILGGQGAAAEGAALV
jgi:hypothetical protein